MLHQHASDIDYIELGKELMDELQPWKLIN